MRRLSLFLGLCIAQSPFALALAAGDADQAYDNPTMGSVPCVVMNEYRITESEASDGHEAFQGNAVVENLCSRSVDVAFCFVYVQPNEDADQTCFGGVVRPGSRSAIRNAALPVQAGRPEYQWRYIP